MCKMWEREKVINQWAKYLDKSTHRKENWNRLGIKEEEPRNFWSLYHIIYTYIGYMWTLEVIPHINKDFCIVLLN